MEKVTTDVSVCGINIISVAIEKALFYGHKRFGQEDDKYEDCFDQ